MSYQIIVARYNEDLKWLSSTSKHCVVINKGYRVNSKIWGQYIESRNIGRESHSYLKYIISNYYNLPDILIFTQGCIDDHCNTNTLNYLLNLRKEAIKNKQSVHTRLYVNNKNSNKAWSPEWNKRNGAWLKETRKGVKYHYRHDPIVFRDWFVKHIAPEYPLPTAIYANGIFAVCKEFVLNRNIQYYQKLLAEVNYHQNPIEGHFFERSWYYIFSPIKLAIIDTFPRINWIDRLIKACNKVTLVSDIDGAHNNFGWNSLIFIQCPIQRFIIAYCKRYSIDKINDFIEVGVDKLNLRSQVESISHIKDAMGFLIAINDSLERNVNKLFKKLSIEEICLKEYKPMHVPLTTQSLEKLKSVYFQDMMLHNELQKKAYMSLLDARDCVGKYVK